MRQEEENFGGEKTGQAGQSGVVLGWFVAPCVDVEAWRLRREERVFFVEGNVVESEGTLQRART